MHIHRKFWFHFFSRSYALFDLRNLTKMKDTTETVGQHNSTETAQQNCVKLCSYEDMYSYRKCWLDLFKEQFISLLNFGQNFLCDSDETGFLSDCPSLILGIAFRCIQHSQAMLEGGVCELAHSFFQLAVLINSFSPLDISAQATIPWSQ